MSESFPGPPLATDFVLLSIVQSYRLLFTQETPTNYTIRSLVSRIQQLGDFIMPRSTQSNVSGKGQFDVTFVNVRLSKKDADQFSTYFSRDIRETGEDLTVFISKGHKIGLSWDDKGACFVASATCRDERSPNYNRCITSRSDDWYEAMIMNVYKHDVLFQGGTWVSDDAGGSWG